MAREGIVTFAPTPEVRAWAMAARAQADLLLADRQLQATWLRHDQTWFVGVDALPNAADGAIGGQRLTGPWEPLIPHTPQWHRAQVSAVYPGYPGRDVGESEAAHRFRRNRFAAHVDGLLPEGPARRRFLREPHAFVLGMPLDDVRASPLMVWPGSHVVMGAALSAAIGSQDPGSVDLTEVYAAARRQVFDTITPVPVEVGQGGAMLLHRHLLHGVKPWETDEPGPRVVAYFRPQFEDASQWAAG